MNIIAIETDHNILFEIVVCDKEVDSKIPLNVTELLVVFKISPFNGSVMRPHIFEYHVLEKVSSYCVVSNNVWQYMLN